MKTFNFYFFLSISLIFTIYSRVSDSKVEYTLNEIAELKNDCNCDGRPTIPPHFVLVNTQISGVIATHTHSVASPVKDSFVTLEL